METIKKLFTNFRKPINYEELKGLTISRREFKRNIAIINEQCVLTTSQGLIPMRLFMRSVKDINGNKHYSTCLNKFYKGHSIITIDSILKTFHKGYKNLTIKQVHQHTIKHPISEEHFLAYTIEYLFTR